MVGLVERFNRTLKDMLAMYVNDCHDSWVKWLPMCTYAYNTGVHTSTAFTPMELMMGRTGRTPSDLLLTATNAGPVVMYHAAYLRHLKSDSRYCSSGT